MTDEQVTIDTCPYQGDCSISGCNRNDDDCFIKRLFEERYKADKQIVELNKMIEAKEQECNGLKRYKSLFEKTRDLWNKASKTNYKLLDEIEDLKDSLKRTICQSECYRYKEAEKLKATLTEIKEIVTNFYETGFLRTDDDCILINNHLCIETLDKILQKISEVLNDNRNLQNDNL